MKTNPNKVRILVADDHGMIREGLKTVIESNPNWELCGESDNGRLAVELTRKLRPSLVLLDITMPELNGLDATRQICKLVPSTKILILTMHDSEALALAVIQAGARGYLLKNDAPELLANAISAVSQGQVFFTSRISDVIMKGIADGVSWSVKDQTPRSRLTLREREIVQLLCEGRTNKETAERLGITVSTVESHRRNVMSKLRLHSVTDLVHYAIRNNIVQP